jgi:hypothetical protein
MFYQSIRCFHLNSKFFIKFKHLKYTLIKNCAFNLPRRCDYFKQKTVFHSYKQVSIKLDQIKKNLRARVAEINQFCIG